MFFFVNSKQHQTKRNLSFRNSTYLLLANFFGILFLPFTVHREKLSQDIRVQSSGGSRRGRGLPDEDVGEAALCLRFRLRAQQRRSYGEGSDAADEGVGVGVVAPALGHRRDLVRPLRPRLLPGEERFRCPHQEEA